MTIRSLCRLSKEVDKEEQEEMGAACCVLRVACCVLRAACCVLRAACAAYWVNVACVYEYYTVLIGSWFSLQVVIVDVI